MPIFEFKVVNNETFWVANLDSIRIISTNDSFSLYNRSSLA